MGGGNGLAAAEGMGGGRGGGGGEAARRGVAKARSEGGRRSEECRRAARTGRDMWVSEEGEMWGVAAGAHWSVRGHETQWGGE